MLVVDLLSQAVTGLANVSDAPQLDAERMLLYVLKKDESSWLAAHADIELTSEQQQEFDRFVAERKTGKPLAYVLGEWEFYGRSFYVTPDVLVPRPETENLIDAVLPYIDVWREKHPGETITIADIGTGSGIIAITLALELPKFHILDSIFHILASDISPAALKLATKNAQRHSVEKQIEFIQGNFLEAIAGRKVDLIMSNPPYIPTSELTQTPPPRWSLGLRFEPQLALDGGPDGQDFIRQIQATKIPAIVESTGGVILKLNL